MTDEEARRIIVRAYENANGVSELMENLRPLAAVAAAAHSYVEASAPARGEAWQRLEAAVRTMRSPKGEVDIEGFLAQADECSGAAATDDITSEIRRIVRDMPWHEVKRRLVFRGSLGRRIVVLGVVGGVVGAPPKERLEILARGLRDPDPGVQDAAVWAMVNAGGREAVGPLRDTLRDALRDKSRGDFVIESVQDALDILDPSIPAPESVDHQDAV